MAVRSEPVAAAPVRELVLTRVFDAPRALVFKAWTDPKHVARWWGPGGFTNPVCEWDARPGSPIRVDMTGPDGVVYPMGGVFHEIVEPERLVFTTIGLDEKGNALHEVHNTVTFAEHEGKTKLTLHAVVVKAAPATAAALAGMEEGWSQSLDKLSEHVEDAAATANRQIVVTRVFNAPRELVFTAWTDPKHVAQWWGPNGFTITVHEMDVRPGGVWRFVMHGPDGTDFPNKIAFVEITPPERLVLSHVSAPQFRMTATFAEQCGKTRLTVRMLFETAEERDRTVKQFGADEGLKQTIGRLEERVARMGGAGR